MRIVATVEARMTSSRLPGKVLKPIMGKSMLEFLLERLKHASTVHDVVVATTVNSTDDAIVEVCQKLRVNFFRGSEEDVLDRVLKAATKYEADLIVEMTGDCPLLDPQVVDDVVKFYLSNDYHYVSNVLNRTFPRGLDTQVFSRAVLEQVNQLTKEPIHREHVSLFIYEHPELYKLGNVAAPPEFSWPDLRLCVDQIEDFQVVSKIFEQLYPKNRFFSWKEVIQLVKHLGLHDVNSQVKQKTLRQNPQEATTTLKAGIVGLGRVASEFDDDPLRKQIATHAGAYKTIPETELVAACDIDEVKLKQFGQKWKVKQLYKDYEEMFTKEKLDILSICTWSDSHYDISVAAIKAGIRIIFCEKPMTNNLHQADQLVALCKKEKVIFAVNHSRRWDKLHQRIRDFINSGKLGKIQTVNVYYTAGIANTGTHILDLLRFFFGDVSWVWSAANQILPNEKDPTLQGVLCFEKGFLAHLCGLDVRDYLILEFDIYGSKGRIRIKNSGYGAKYWTVSHSPFFSGYNELQEASLPIEFGDREMMVSAVRDLISCYHSGNSPASTEVDGVKVLELICALKNSAKSSKQIALPLMDRDQSL